jgi:hypothetical protein
MTEVFVSESHFLTKENEELKRDIKSLQRRIRLLRSALSSIKSPLCVTARRVAEDAFKADSKLSRLAIEVKKMMRRPIGGSSRMAPPQVSTSLTAGSHVDE